MMPPPCPQGARESGGNRFARVFRRNTPCDAVWKYMEVQGRECFSRVC